MIRVFNCSNHISCEISIKENSLLRGAEVWYAVANPGMLNSSLDASSTRFVARPYADRVSVVFVLFVTCTGSLRMQDRSQVSPPASGTFMTDRFAYATQLAGSDGQLTQWKADNRDANGGRHATLPRPSTRLGRISRGSASARRRAPGRTSPNRPREAIAATPCETRRSAQRPEAAANGGVVVELLGKVSCWHAATQQRLSVNTSTGAEIPQSEVLGNPCLWKARPLGIRNRIGSEPQHRSSLDLKLATAKSVESTPSHSVHFTGRICPQSLPRIVPFAGNNSTCTMQYHLAAIC